MPDDAYSLADLSRLADVTPRTVRYYIAQGLLPGPEGAGAGAHYGEGHLARLRLIRRLQREHLPLAEIRVRLERWGDDEVIATVRALDARPAETGPEPGDADALGYVRSLMARANVRPRLADAGDRHGLRLGRLAVRETLGDAYAAAAPPPPAAWTGPPPSAAAPAPADPGAPAPAPSRPGASRPGADRSTWERIVLSPDVELHVRRPLDRHTNKRLERLERIARELFDEP